MSLDLGDSTFGTTGVGASAVRAVSIGGGGGAGGSAGGIVALGGSGAAGGDGGPSDSDALTLTLDGVTVTTQGQQASGIEAMSIGGGGGSASSSGGLIDLGGSGSGGGSGRSLSVTSANAGINVTTKGDFADGVSLQSIGGGGGKGGSSFTLAVTAAELTHAQGGSGGAGGSSGAVVYTGSANDTISTSGDNAAGFLAQSIGGGGGRSGNDTTIQIGASMALNQGATSEAASGGGASKVSINLQGKSIETSGHLAPGVVVQSVGGGGGSAGTSTSVTVGIQIGNTMGASGGDGGSSGYVYVDSTSAITTQGDGSDGILAQSVGGGGGHSATTINVTDGLSLPSFTKSLGSTPGGGTGGSSGSSNVQNNGTIVTHGDNASGIVSQSIAGGGGRSGDTISGSLSINIGQSTLGQSGGSGGNAQFSHVLNQGAITTSGHNAGAILAQSIGGGGGVGGAVIHGDIGLNFSTTHGADGGVGGTANYVQVFNHSDLTTGGAQSSGIVAQSLGGGGGAGGLTVDGSISLANMAVALGSTGGNGGKADYSHVTNHATIATAGDQSHGILAQSIGGSGGQAGNVIQGDVSGGEVSGSVDVAVGGAGGAGGSAALAHVENSGTVTTQGFASIGILAQSIGGDGGHGGSIYSGTLNVSLEDGIASTTAIGGDGGDSGAAGDVQIENTGTDVDGANVTTSGHFAHAIVGQSVGGNGGVAGASYAGTSELTTGDSISTSTSVGGSGGSGAVAGTVTITNAATIATTGGNAYGILGQSIGGNGGAAGAGHAYFGDLSKETEEYFNVNATIGVGGSGGTGSNAAAVTVTNSGAITTGIDSTGAIVSGADTGYGILAQSIGGGGGDGGGAGATSGGYTKLPKDADGNKADGSGISMKVSIGGSGGASGNGDTVTVTNDKGGSVTTGGIASHAIFAQSIGGGGGSGGDGKPSDSGWIAKLEADYDKLKDAKENYEKLKAYYKKLTGSDEEAEKKARAIKEHTIEVNGKDGAAGTGGTVTITNDGTLTTKGESAAGVFAQSIGGGGGASGAGSQGLADSLTVSGAGSGGGDGGSVTISGAGSISTAGDKAPAIFAQSVGGGGGAAGDVATVLGGSLSDLAKVMGSGKLTNDTSSNSDSDSDDSTTIVGGKGGDVTVTVSDTVTTSGAYAHGVFAQSVGGAGGAKGELSAGDGTGSIGSETGAGDGGVVTVTVDGSIKVDGDNAVGIVAQSAAGDDGASYSGGVDITVNGTVTASGSGSRAILAQAAESGSSDTNTAAGRGITQITIAKGATVSATSTDAAEVIGLIDGRSVVAGDGTLSASNVITNNGTLTSASDDVYVVHATNGATAIENTGTLAGAILLSNSHVNTLHNAAGATLQIGTTLNLGSQLGASFTNDGILQIGEGDSTITSAFYAGTVDITSAGTITFDVASSADQSGKVTVDYDRVQLASDTSTAVTLAVEALDFNWTSAAGLTNGASRELEIISGSQMDTVQMTKGGSDIHGDYSLTTPTATWDVHYQGGDQDHLDMTLNATYTIDYSGETSGAGLGGTARDFGAHFGTQMGRLAAAGETVPKSVRDTLEMAALEFLNLDSADALETLYEELSPEETLIAAKRSARAALSLHNLVQSCPTIDASDGAALLRQQDCLWAKGIGGYSRNASMDRAPSYTESVGGFAIAGQKEIFDHTFLEVGAQYEHLWIDGGNFDHQGNAYGIAASLKREMGIFTVSGTIAGGLSNLDYSRAYSIGGQRYRANSTIDGRFVSAEGRVFATLQNQGGFYAKPAVALAVTHNWQDGFTEKGAGPYNWRLNDVEATHVYLTPSLEVGRAFEIRENPILAYVRAGVQTALTEPEHSVVSNIVDGGSALAGLDTVMSDDRFVAALSAGVKMDVGERVTLSLEGDSAFSEHSTNLGGMARIDVRF
ncbi:hypothetical protein MRB58_05885 [Acuticoccus sp. I52.16.1]|nr:hypothetical protein MRB58_05885 [Acuticoccus sp. I52.16.1]